MIRIIIFLFLISNLLFSYSFIYQEGPICSKDAEDEIIIPKVEPVIGAFPEYWQPRLAEITKSAISYWNEAGSKLILEYSDEYTSDFNKIIIDYGDIYAYYLSINEENPEAGQTAWALTRRDKDVVRSCFMQKSYQF